MLAARDGMKTMVSRTRSILDFHPEVKQRRALFPVFCSSVCIQYDTRRRNAKSLPPSCTTLNGNWRTKNGVGLETKLKKSYTGFSHFWLTQSHKPHCLRLDIVLGLVYNFSRSMCRALYISLNTQWLRITVSSRRMEPSDFMSNLARWMRLMIYCTLMPAYRAWLSLHPLSSTYPLLGTYLLTTYTYKRMCLLTRVYGINVYSMIVVCKSQDTTIHAHSTMQLP